MSLPAPPSPQSSHQSSPQSTHQAKPIEGPSTLRLRRPDDWHIHLRDGPALQRTVADAAARFGRAIVMPNLRPPVLTTAQATAYRERILAAVPPGLHFEPLMTLYLTDHTAPDEITRAKESGIVHAAKLYPAGATTNSDAGVTDLARLDAVLERMQDCGLVLCVHGEVTDAEVDIFDRERRYIDSVLAPLTQRYPALRIVFEHITTREAVDFVRTQAAQLGATLTAHHLLLNRNNMLVGGIRPHHYCLPVLKRETHRLALLAAATSGDAQFFLGTDSAPHAQSTKETACGCAGCYTAHAGIELYAEAFDSVGALDQLEAFASLNGPAFYSLAPNPDFVTLRRQPWSVPAQLDYLPADPLIPLRAGETLAWQLAPGDVPCE